MGRQMRCTLGQSFGKGAGAANAAPHAPLRVCTGPPPYGGPAYAKGVHKEVHKVHKEVHKVHKEVHKVHKKV